MKNAALILCVFLMISARSLSQEQDLKIVTLNIRYDNPSDGVNRWDNRKEMVAGYLMDESADIIGLQEVLAHQLDYLSSRLSGYGYTGSGRDDGKSGGEFSPLFYNKVRFKLIDSGTFWLSPEPADTASVGWDAALTRICTWALLLDNYSADTILAMNTHFDHVGEIARQESAGLLKSFIAYKTGWSSVILTGDFNCSPEDPPYDVMTRGANPMTDACSASGTQNDKINGTFNGFGSATVEERIDLILFQGGLAVSSCQVKRIRDGDVFISDHFPVVAVLSAL